MQSLLASPFSFIPMKLQGLQPRELRVESNLKHIFNAQDASRVPNTQECPGCLRLSYFQSKTSVSLPATLPS